MTEEYHSIVTCFDTYKEIPQNKKMFHTAQCVSVYVQ